MYRLQSVSKLIKVGSFHTVDTVKEEIVTRQQRILVLVWQRLGEQGNLFRYGNIAGFKVTPFSFLFRLTHLAFVCLCPTRALGQYRGFQFQVLPVNGLPPNTTFDNFIDKK